MVLTITSITLLELMRLITRHFPEVFGLHWVPWRSCYGWQIIGSSNSCFGLVVRTFWLHCCRCYPQFVFCALTCSSKRHPVFLGISVRRRFHFMFVTIKPVLHHDMFKYLSMNIYMNQNIFVSVLFHRMLSYK